MASIIIGNMEKKIASGATIEQTMLSFGLFPDSFLFLVDGAPVPMDTPIDDTMTVKAVKVASGG